MDACYSCPNATGVYTKKASQFSSDGSAFLSSSTNIETNYHMCTEANETFCSSMWGNHYNFCPTDKSCKEANNEGCSYCPKNTFDPPGFLGGYFSGVGGEWTDDKKSCLTAQDVDGTYACGSDPNGKYYCNANGDGKCMDSCDSCSEFQYDEMTGEAKENVFKHIDGKNMCRNIHCAEIQSKLHRRLVQSARSCNSSNRIRNVFFPGCCPPIEIQIVC